MDSTHLSLVWMKTWNSDGAGDGGTLAARELVSISLTLTSQS